MITALHAVCRSLDILICTLWLAPLYVLGLSDRCTGRQMISSYIGRAASNGHRWALLPERVIDTIFAALGDGPNHCRRAFKHYEDKD